MIEIENQGLVRGTTIFGGYLGVWDNTNVVRAYFVIGRQVFSILGAIPILGC